MVREGMGIGEEEHLDALKENWAAGLFIEGSFVESEKHPELGTLLVIGTNRRGFAYRRAKR